MRWERCNIVRSSEAVHDTSLNSPKYPRRVSPRIPYSGWYAVRPQPSTTSTTHISKYCSRRGRKKITK